MTPPYEDIDIMSSGQFKRWVWVKHPELSYTAAVIIEDSLSSSSLINKKKDTKVTSFKNRNVKDEMVVHVMTQENMEMEVPLSHIFPMNPSKFKYSPDLSLLSHLNEPSLLFNLRLRYDHDMVYTWSGLFLLSVNPYKEVKDLYGIDNKELYRPLKASTSEICDLPHIYKVASDAYSSMYRDNENQSILITGESGAGKTENTKKVISFLSYVANSDSIYEKISEMILETNVILEAFGNAQTIRNDNSSRFGKFIKIEFKKGKIVGAHIEKYLLEKSRVTKVNTGEKNYHVFYYFLSAMHNKNIGNTNNASASTIQNNGKDLDDFDYIPNDVKDLLETLKRECLVDTENFSYLASNLGFLEENEEDFEHFCSLLRSLRFLKFSESEIVTLFKALSSILYLGNLKFIEANDEPVLINVNIAEKICKLLNIDIDEFMCTLMRPVLHAGKDIVRDTRSVKQIVGIVDALSRILYERMFDYIIGKLNVVLSSTNPDKNNKEKHRRSSSLNDGINYIGVLDIAGFEIFTQNGFEQLCINLTNEKLQQFFNHHMFILEQEIYKKENIEWTYLDFGMDLQPTIDIIERSNPIGILAYLDEECVMPGGTDRTFLQKLNRLNKFSSNNSINTKFEVSKLEEGFSIDHYAGKVTYMVKDWLKKNRDPYFESIINLLRNSGNQHIKRIILSDGNINLYDGGLKKGFFRSVSQKHKESLNRLLGLLRQTKPHFVRCLLPNSQKLPNKFENPLVLNQMRCNGIMEGIRISRLGYPNRISFREFRKRYAILSMSEKIGNEFVDNKQACLEILKDISNTLNIKINSSNNNDSVALYTNENFNKLVNANNGTVLTDSIVKTNAKNNSNLNVDSSSNVNAKNNSNLNVDSSSLVNANNNSKSDINANNKSKFKSSFARPSAKVVNANITENSDFYANFVNNLKDHSISDSHANNRTCSISEENINNSLFIKNENNVTDLWKMGNTLIFFKSGILAHIEELREKKVEIVAKELQKKIRKLLLIVKSQEEETRKEQIKVIQKNARIHLELKKWGWWRLYQKIKPLLEITKHDEEIKNKEKEIGFLNEKLMISSEKIEELKQKNKYKDSIIEKINREIENERMIINEKEELLMGLRNENNDIKERMNQTEDENTEKNKIIESMNKEITEYNKLLDTQKFNNESLTSNLQEKESIYKKEIMNLKDEIEVGKKNIKKLNDEIKNYKNEIETSKKQIEEINVENIKIKKEVENQSKIVKENERINEIKDNKIKELCNNLETMEMGKDSCIKKLIDEKNYFSNELEKEKNKNKHKIEDLEKKIRTMNEEKNKEKIIHDSIEEKNQKLKNENETLKDNLELISFDIIEKDRKMLEKINEIERLKKENKNSDEKIIKLSDETELMKKEISELKKENNKIKEELNKEKRILKNKDKEIEMYKRELKKKDEEKLEIEAKYNEEKLKIIKDAKNKTNLKENENLKKIIEDLNDDFNEMKKKDIIKIKELKSKLEKYKNLEREIEDVKSIIDSKINAYNSFFYEILEKYRKEIDEKNNEIDSLNNKNTSIIKEILSEKKILKDALDESKSEITKLNVEANRIKINNENSIKWYQNELKETLKEINNYKKIEEENIAIKKENKDLKNNNNHLEEKINSLNGIWNKIDLLCIKIKKNNENEWNFLHGNKNYSLEENIFKKNKHDMMELSISNNENTKYSVQKDNFKVHDLPITHNENTKYKSNEDNYKANDILIYDNEIKNTKYKPIEDNYKANDILIYDNEIKSKKALITGDNNKANDSLISNNEIKSKKALTTGDNNKDNDMLRLSVSNKKNLEDSKKENNKLFYLNNNPEKNTKLDVKIETTPNSSFLSENSDVEKSLNYEENVTSKEIIKMKKVDELIAIINFEKQKNDILNQKLENICAIYNKYSTHFTKMATNEKEANEKFKKFEDAIFNLNEINLTKDLENKFLKKEIEICLKQIKDLKADIRFIKNNKMNEYLEIKDENYELKNLKYKNNLLERENENMNKNIKKLEKIYKEAKDEIERIRKENERFEDEYIQKNYEHNKILRKIEKYQNEKRENQDIMNLLITTSVFNNCKKI